mmetsp:Transcript_11259/g.39219  ORF Transcript_11259/g.39219 Transcript_11259/m.39219 type:complete len:109 (-) Transcript_11259:59-385(-)
MPAVWFPKFTMTLMRRASAAQPANNLVFRVDPKMTKPEIRQYLERVYGLPVTRVATVNYDGKVKRSGRHFYQQNAYKKAYVRIDPHSAVAAARVGPSARPADAPLVEP